MSFGKQFSFLKILNTTTKYLIPGRKLGGHSILENQTQIVST